MSYFANLLTQSAHSLFLPKEHKVEVERYVWTHQQTRTRREQAPFRRQVDFWALSIATALAKCIPPKNGSPSSWGVKFVDTREVDLGEELSSFLAIIAVAKLGYDDENVDNPGNILDLANKLAGAGCPFILQEMSKDNLIFNPLDRAISFSTSLFHEVKARS